MLTVIMADAMGAYSHNIPASIPKVAGYVTGYGQVPWTPANWARFTMGQVVRIDQSPGMGDIQANVKDIEAECATDKDGLCWARERIALGIVPCWYKSAGGLTSLLNTLIAGGVTSGELWVAAYSLSYAEARGLVMAQYGPFPVKAVQWASPTSNPHTILPGTSLTLEEANADLSVAEASWQGSTPLPGTVPAR